MLVDPIIICSTTVTTNEGEKEKTSITEIITTITTSKSNSMNTPNIKQTPSDVISLQITFERG
jgi:hypothetical protein